MSNQVRLPKEPIGWPLLVVPVNGELHYPSLEDSIKHAIRIILLTPKGGLLMHANFGAGLSTYLHQPNQLITRRRIQDAIIDSINKWEPRIILDSVDVWEIPEEVDAVRVVIEYRIKRTGVKENVKLTMNLGS